MPALSASCSCVILRCSRSALILVAIRSLGAMLCLIGVQNQNLFFSKHESLVEILLPIHVRSAAYIAPHTDRGRERRGQRVNCVQKIALKNFPNRYVNFRSGLRGNVAALVTMPNSMARGLHADCCLWDTKTLADALFGSAPEYWSRPRNSQSYSESTSIRSSKALCSRYASKKRRKAACGLGLQPSKDPQKVGAYQSTLLARVHKGRDDVSAPASLDASRNL